MTEHEWLACADPMKMLVFLHGNTSDRKARLLACACCWAIRHWLKDHRSTVAVETSERYADGAASETELATAHAEARVTAETLAATGARDKFARAAWAPFGATEGEAWRAAWGAAWPAMVAAPALVTVLRDIFGNPFRPPPVIDPGVLAWHGGAARRLAEAIYAERRFGDVPVLADLLEEAGLTDATLLGHLRGPGPHVLGCWGLDAALGKW
jgi:hypothetical protein